MTTKPITPYERLRRIAAKWAGGVVNPHRRAMWLYPKAKLGSGWSLADLYERCKAGDQLGYDVRCVAADDGLRVEYVKRPEAIPPEFLR